MIEVSSDNQCYVYSSNNYTTYNIDQLDLTDLHLLLNIIIDSFTEKYIWTESTMAYGSNDVINKKNSIAFPTKDTAYADMIFSVAEKMKGLSLNNVFNIKFECINTDGNTCGILYKNDEKIIYSIYTVYILKENNKIEYKPYKIKYDESPFGPTPWSSSLYEDPL